MARQLTDQAELRAWTDAITVALSAFGARRGFRAYRSETRIVTKVEEDPPLEGALRCGRGAGGLGGLVRVRSQPARTVASSPGSSRINSLHTVVPTGTTLKPDWQPGPTGPPPALGSGGCARSWRNGCGSYGM